MPDTRLDRLTESWSFPDSGLLFVVSGTRNEYLNFVFRHAYSLASINLYEVTDADIFRGASCAHYYVLIGSWHKRSDIREVLFNIATSKVTEIKPVLQWA